MNASPTPGQLDQLEESDETYRRCMRPMLGLARQWFPSLRGFERDLYQAAWVRVLRQRGGVQDVERYLERALFSEGVDRLRARERRPTISLERLGVEDDSPDAEADERRSSRRRTEWLIDRTVSLPEEQVETREDARVVAELVGELTPLQQRIIKLRWGLGLARKDAAPLLGISERTAKRALEEASALLAEKVELVRAERWCENKKSLVLAYSFDLLSAKRAAKAERHLEACLGCKRAVRALRMRFEDLAAVVPLPLLLVEPPAHGPLAMAADLAEEVGSTVFDLAASAKQHALAILTRTPAGEAATTQVAMGGGFRGSGGAIAAVTACLAAGGGATYCAVEGVPEPLRDLARIERPREPHKRSKPKPKPREVAAPAPVAVPPEPQAGADRGDRPEAPAQSDSTEQSSETIPASPAPPGSREFGAASSSSAKPGPAPAPSGGGGEFTP